MELIDLTPLINAIITVLAALLTPRVISWLKAKTTAEQRAELQYWVKVAVAAAEQQFKSDRGCDKKEFVCMFLNSRGFDVNTDELDNAIEAAVLELHSKLYGGDNNGDG